MKKVKRADKAKRPSKLEELTAATFQDHTHLSTYEVAQRRGALEEQAHALEQEIVRLSAATADARATLRRIGARILGLGLVVERR